MKSTTGGEDNIQGRRDSMERLCVTIFSLVLSMWESAIIMSGMDA